MIRPTATVLLSILLSAALPAAQAAPSDEATLARYRHASACVAVMKQDVERLADRYRAGSTAVRPEMLRLTELGFAFIGTAYKWGLRNPQADQLLEEAEAQVARQSPEAQQKLSSGCQAEAGGLLREANGLERALVNNRARARVERLLTKAK